MAGKLIIKQVRSTIGRLPAQRQALLGLGLRGIGKQVERADIPRVRGQIKVVSHLVTVQEVGSGDEA